MLQATDLPELETLRETSPEGYRGIRDILALAEARIAPELTEPMRRRVAEAFGDDVGEEPDQPPLARAIADFADQFVFYVAGITPDLRKPLEDALPGDELQELVKVLYAIDMGYRLRLVHRSLFRPQDDGPLGPVPSWTPTDGLALDAAIKGLYRTATLVADRLVDDPEAIEFLRLRCAHYHDCHT